MNTADTAAWTQSNLQSCTGSEEQRCSTMPCKRFAHFNSAMKAADQQVPIRIPPREPLDITIDSVVPF
jgi:hypothetical protein